MPAAPQWLARGEAHLPESIDWLTAAELAYAQSQRFRKRRSEFLIARLTAKTAVARFLGWPNTIEHLARIEIRHEPTGAPFLCVDGDRPPLAMSLTDRADWAVCVVREGAARIGCDLELVEPRSWEFVRDWFTAAERVQVGTSGEQELLANLIWSAKESALKVLQTGLRRDTRSVEVRLGSCGGPGWQPLSVVTTEGAEFPGWWRRFGSFVLTTAAEDDVLAPVSLDDADLLSTAEPSHAWLADPAG